MRCDDRLITSVRDRTVNCSHAALRPPLPTLSPLHSHMMMVRVTIRHRSHHVQGDAVP
jgi:hypothetical protein